VDPRYRTASRGAENAGFGVQGYHTDYGNNNFFFAGSARRGANLAFSQTHSIFFTLIFL
jgi:hypothetical protein